MIQNSKQNWEPGQQVRVGFLTLRVRAAIATPGDWLPDAYILSNLSGYQLYKFVPHNGLEKITPEEAQALMADATRHAARLTASVLRQAGQAAAIDKIFA